MLHSTIRDKNYILSNQELLELDKRTVSDYQIPEAVLMEEAAERIYTAIKNDFPGLASEKICIISGTGNNGGDALSIARKFFFEKINFDIYLFPDKKGSTLYETHKQILSALNVKLCDIKSLSGSINDYTIIIDGLFGVGYEPREDTFIEKIFSDVNSSNAKVISIDIPSGLNTKNKSSIKADFTYSAGFMKKLFFNPETRSGSGLLRNIKISFYQEKINNINHALYINEIKPLAIKKNPFVHKYKRGSVLCIGGEAGKLGSIIFTAESAMKTGCGISLIITEKKNIASINKMSKSVISDSFENLEKYIGKYNTIVIGPGLNTSEKNLASIKNIFALDKQLILDASFFTLFDKEVLKTFKNPPLLTPHTQEFKSFFKEEAISPDKEMIDTVIDLSKKYNTHILLKDSFLIYSGTGTESFVYDNPKRILAQAGSGDILAGILAGVVSQGYKLFDAVLEGIRLFYHTAEIFENKNLSSYSQDDFIKLLNR